MLIGRLKQPCAACGFEAPHVRQNEGKHPTIYCPDCGLTTPGRTGKQAAGILANMRPEGEPHAVPQIPRRADDIVISAPAAPVATKPAPTPRSSGFVAMQTLLHAVTK